MNWDQPEPSRTFFSLLCVPEHGRHLNLKFNVLMAKIGRYSTYI